jgi:hypothetical protein
VHVRNFMLVTGTVVVVVLTFAMVLFSRRTYMPKQVFFFGQSSMI